MSYSVTFTVALCAILAESPAQAFPAGLIDGLFARSVSDDLTSTCTLNQWTASATGGVCYWDSSRTDCAICVDPENDCQCYKDKPNTCVPCNTNLCTTETNCNPNSTTTTTTSTTTNTNTATFTPKLLYQGGSMTEESNYGGNRLRSLDDYKNWYINYGDWNKDDIVTTLHTFNMAALHWGGFSGTEDDMKSRLHDIQVGEDGQKGTSDDVAVLMYISIGEESASPKATEGKLIAGDGSGPVHLNPDGSTDRVPEYDGVADFYVDKNDSNTEDKNVDWNSYYIDGTSALWQKIILDEADHWLNDLGFDGIFLDTPDVADPWNGHGWVANGILAVVKALDEKFTKSLFLLNRGVFFYAPHISYQFDNSPAPHVDFVLFESFFADSDYHHPSSYWQNNRNMWLTKMLTEFSRPGDNYGVVLQLDYWEDPDSAPSTENWSLYLDDLQTFGTKPYIANKEVTSSSNVAAENLPADQYEPTWSNSANGYTSTCDANADYYAAKGETSSDDHTNTRKEGNKGGRVGVQSIGTSESGTLTIEWDLAVDQTRPVRYNLYVSTGDLDFSNPTKVSSVESTEASHSLSSAESSDLQGGSTLLLANIGSAMPSTYKGTGYHCGGRTFLDQEKVYPYEFTLKGLKSGSYTVTLRAEDSTVNATIAKGHLGPNGGIEESNTVKKTVTVA
eukprot:Clim_evm1s97 gene=Clim_evmTU1s97